MIKHESFYGAHELEAIRPMFKHIGKNVKISRHANFYNPQNISIEDNSRIDDFCILSAGHEILIGKYVHIGAYTCLMGEATISMHDYSGLSTHCAVYSSSDSYSGEFMTNPCVPRDLRKIHTMSVTIREHAVVGSHSIIMPGVHIGPGAAIGSKSFIYSPVNPHTIEYGDQRKGSVIKPRKEGMYKLAEQLTESCE